MTKVTMYGIKNCDTIKKAQQWLTSNAIEYSFHDYRKEGLSPELLAELADKLGWENLLNKRGTTFRQLDDSQKTDLDQAKALQLLINHPAMIKRPVLVVGGQYHLGFKPAQYQVIFS